PQSLAFGDLTPKLSAIWTSYSPSNFTPEFDPFGTTNSKCASTSPKSSRLMRLKARPMGPLTRTPEPGSEARNFGFFASRCTPPTAVQPPLGDFHGASPDRSIQSGSAARAAAGSRPRSTSAGTIRPASGKDDRMGDTP